MKVRDCIADTRIKANDSQYENKRNACDFYLRGKGACSGMFEITKDKTLPEFIMPGHYTL